MHKVNDNHSGRALIDSINHETFLTKVTLNKANLRDLKAVTGL